MKNRILIASMFCALLSNNTLLTVAQETAPQKALQQANRILFLGDSITYAGQYVAYFETCLLGQRKSKTPAVINAGLPSETVSGLSEEGHAGGKFPRPDLAERLERVLKTTQPDLVIACYGINCAIYQPFAEERLAKYQAGMKHLKTLVEKHGGQLILVTPPFYDDQQSPKAFSYNEVLDRYSQWLVAQRAAGWMVIDLHTSMTRAVQQHRQTDPKFTFQRDGVHPNSEGHWAMAQQLFAGFGDEKAAACATPDELLQLQQLPAEVLPLVQQRMSLLRNAYLTASGHQRPGIAAGLPLPEAETKSQEITAKIAPLLRAKQP